MEGLVPNKDVRPVHLEIDYSISPDKILTPQKRAKILGWHVEDVLIADSVMGVFANYPLRCKQQECQFASSCEFSNDARFLDTRCIVEKVIAFQLFLSYVKELEVLPTAITDINMIGSLIKLHLNTRRLDLQQSEETMTEDIVTLSGKSITRTRQISVLSPEQRAIRQEISKIYDKLLISRESRMKKEIAEGKAEKDATSTIASLLKAIGSTKGSSASRKRHHEDLDLEVDLDPDLKL